MGIHPGYYVQNAIMAIVVIVCSSTLVLQWLRAYKKLQVAGRLNGRVQYHVLPVTTRAFLVEATVIMLLWAVKEIDPYHVYYILPQAYLYTVSTIVTALGITFICVTIVTLLRSAEKSACTTIQCIPWLSQWLPKALYTIALLMLLVSFAVSAAIYTLDRSIYSNIFLAIVALVCGCLTLLLNYGSNQIKNVLNNHQTMDGKQPPHVIAGLRKMRRTQAYWSLFLLAGAGLCLYEALMYNPLYYTAAALDYNPSVLRVDPTEWVVVIGLAVSFWYCWIPLARPAQVTPVSQQGSHTDTVILSKTHRGTHSSRHTPLYPMYSLYPSGPPLLSSAQPGGKRLTQTIDLRGLDVLDVKDVVVTSSASDAVEHKVLHAIKEYDSALGPSRVHIEAS